MCSDLQLVAPLIYYKFTLGWVLRLRLMAKPLVLNPEGPTAKQPSAIKTTPVLKTYFSAGALNLLTMFVISLEGYL